MENARILVTGGAGFIGTAFARRLLPKNRIVIFDNGHRNSLRQTDLINHPNLTYIQGDVLDQESLKKAIDGCDVVVHLAAIAGVDTVLKMPVETMKVALIGTYNALEAAMTRKSLHRFIDFSTSEVFGSYSYKMTEGDVTSVGAVGEARWTYAVSKLATEHLAHNYFKQYGLKALSVRPFNIYGPGQVGEGAIHRFIVKALNEEDIDIHNDGSQIRAWCFINDIVDFLELAMENDAAVGEAFNVGNPRSVCTVYNLARQIVGLTKSRSQTRFVKWPFQDVELRVPNIEKGRKLLGFEPKVDLDEGLQLTIDHYARLKKA